MQWFRDRMGHASVLARRRRCARRGFTLLELVTVVVILGVMSAIAIPRFGDFSHGMSLDAAERQMLVDIERARRRAIESGASVTVAFRPVQDAYFISALPSLDRSDQTYSVRLAEEPYGVDLVSADFAGTTNLTFNAYGEALYDGTVTFSLAGRTRTVTVAGLEADAGGAQVIE